QWGMTDLMKRMPFLATPGNHDYNSIAPPQVSQNPLNNTGAYYDLIDVYTNGEMGGVPSGHELFYSFDYGNIHFINMNSEIGSVLSASNDWTGANPFSSFNGSPMTQWIHADLQANTKPWVIAIFHQPPHTEGSHSSSDLFERYMAAMRNNICPILEQYGVDIILNGHSHVYERSYFLNGYFGTPDQFNPSVHAMDISSGSLVEGTPYIKYTTGPNAGKGTVYVVQGNSGSSTTEPALTHPAMASVHGCDSCVGSHLFYIHGDTLTGKYLTGEGEILDEYAIVKQEGPSGIAGTVNDGISGLEVFPNPFSNVTTVRFEVKKDIIARVEIVSVSGQVIHVFHSGKLNQGAHQYTVNASAMNLSKGAYLVRISSDSQPAVARMLKVE
ncbi:MAG: metallophosphoesterase, partial [Flavobacteriales bacterium]|nr:metallophosphoesterase [Flavobacteriales bacterium]